MPSVYRKSGGSWTKIKRIYRKNSGSWDVIRRVYRKVAGSWQIVFSGKTAIAQTVTLTKSINSSTGLVTLTGTNYNWDPAPTSLKYEFRKDGVGVIATGTATNPTVSNTYDTTISATSNIISPNEANNFVFAIMATYAGPDEESVSNSETIYGAEDITLSENLAVKTNDSIGISWTSSAHAGRFKVEYKLNSNTNYTFFNGYDGSSAGATITGLDKNYLYDFKVTPYTGTSNSGSTFTGYPGNPAYITGLQPYQWFTVTWNANGGTSNPSTSTQTQEGGSVSVPTPVRLGYRFDGWFTATGSSSMIIDPLVTTYTPTADITLYAHWTKVYTITYYINGGSGSVPSPQTAADGEEVTLLFSPLPTIDNGSWKGWDENPNALASNAQYSNIGYPYSSTTTVTVTKDLNLYAIYLMTAPPTNTVAPSISTTIAYIGQTVSSDGGQWTSNAKSYQYQWQYNAGGTWVSCTGSGNTSLSYTVNGTDMFGNGSNIRLKVTAWTGVTAGTGISAVAYSNNIAVYPTGTCSITNNNGVFTIGNTYSSNIYQTYFIITDVTGVTNNFADGSTSPSFSWVGYNSNNFSTGTGASTTIAVAGRYLYAVQLVYDANTGKYWKSNQASYGPTVAQLVCPQPTFDANNRTATGFTGRVNNYAGSNYTYSFSTSAGTVTPGTPDAPGGYYPFTVSGLSAGQSATVTVTVTRNGYVSASGTTSGTALVGDSTLSGLSLSSGTLSPSFSSSTTSYSVTLPNGTSSITVTPTATSGSATITVNGSSVSSGSASQSISLTAGSSTSISVVVSAPGSTTTYTISASRNLPAISITLSSATVTTSGFTFTLTSTYDSSWTWSASISGSPAGVSISPATGSSTGQTYTVSGMGPLTVTTATAVITATKTGYDTATASRTATAITTTISGWAISDITAAAPTPSAITPANSATPYQGICTWTNGTGTDTAWMSAISGSGSGAQTDNGTARTSATFTIVSTGTVTATVTNVAKGKARITWNQSNAQSYVLQYSVAGSTVSTGIVNDSSSTVNVDLLSNGTAITLVSLTVYPNTNGGGTGVPGVVPATKSVTPTNKTGTNTGTGYVTMTVNPHFPPFFPPHFPPFFPPHFPPFFPPYFPPGPFFPPYFSACIDEDTLIAVVGENDSIEYKAAKDIRLGDETWSVKWDGLSDERDLDPYSWFSNELNSMEFTKTNIVNIIPSIKDATILINNDLTKRFSLEQTVLLNRGGRYFFGTTGTLEIGDILIEKTEDGRFIEIDIKSLDIIDEQRTVYQFDAEPGDILIAGNLIVHNAKGFA